MQAFYLCPSWAKVAAAMATERPRATEAQLRYLDGLTHPERLAQLSSGEARYLIAWLRGPPANMTRAQQLYLSSLVDGLSREQVRGLVEHLRGLVAPPAAEVGR